MEIGSTRWEIGSIARGRTCANALNLAPRFGVQPVGRRKAESAAPSGRRARSVAQTCYGRKRAGWTAGTRLY